ncbi:Mov34/MPN/PAD-1 family protein [Microbacterium sp. ARD31]|uniref:Mov34/MPN/PAD-1 family protein n=1 Tax=Microbacterium sp. ARD31 TaxID=2962576 RepID=UPI0037C783E4
MVGEPGVGQMSGQEGSNVLITKEALAAIEQHVRAGGVESETGGILLGHETSMGCHVSVAGGPGPRAVRTPTSFDRDLDHAEELAQEAWQQQRAVWLGEWHTHVHVRPVPSETDLSSYLRHLDDADLGFDRFISIIIGPVGVPSPPARLETYDASISRDFPHVREHAPTIVTWVIEGRTATAVPLHLGALP